MLETADLVFAAACGASAMAGVLAERWRAWLARKVWRRRRRPQAEARGKVTPILARVRAVQAAQGPTQAADQLAVVAGAAFQPRRLLSQAEARVLYAVEDAIAARKLPWRVMAQVCLGEILASPDEAAYRAINSKRVDLLVIDRGGRPLAAIEYQGEGHYQGTAPIRDAVKKEALRRAGVRYIEVTPEDRPEDIAHEVGKLGARAAVKAGPLPAHEGA